MKTHEKIRFFRELNQWSQEYMAEQLNMKASGYAKIERNESKINTERLQQIAQIFNLNSQDLLDDGDFMVYINSGNNSSNTNNRYNGNIQLSYEIEKLNLIIQHQQEIINHQQDEIKNLTSVLEILKSKL